MLLIESPLGATFELILPGPPNTRALSFLPHPPLAAKVEEICGVLSGLVMACDYKNGRELLKDREFTAYKAFFRHLFETVTSSRAHATHALMLAPRHPHAPREV